MSSAQSFKSHTRWDPPYHFFAALLLLINVGVAIWWCVKHFSVEPFVSVWVVLVAMALLVLVAKTRSYPLKAQDRVIRLEEKQRLAALASPSELVEVESLTLRQYVALRFASNAELPDLARRAVREKMTEKEIKAAIVSWRPDEERV